MDASANGFITAAAAMLAAGLAAHIRRRRRRSAPAPGRADAHLARTAHELRSPLSVVLGALELARSDQLTPEEQRRFLDDADLAARHLAFLVDDVLDEAAIAAGRLRVDVRSHPVADLLRAAERALGLQAARRDVRLAFAAPPPALRVEADDRRLQQVLFNLVGNAIKFSPEGGRVPLLVEHDDRAVRFRVLDDGDGVPAAVRARLFEPFASGDAGRGTGLGLHICRRLVEQMGGRIGHAPRAARGSEFWFELPRAPDAIVATLTPERG